MIRVSLTVRRDKLFAQWAADELNLDDSARAELQRLVLPVKDGEGHDARLLTQMVSRFTDHAQLPLNAYLAAALGRSEVGGAAAIARGASAFGLMRVRSAGGHRVCRGVVLQDLV